MTTSSLEVAFTCPGAPDVDKFHVPRFDGTEKLSGLCSFEIDLRPPPHDIELLLKLSDLVGQRATLTLSNADGKREIHGLISEAEYTGSEYLDSHAAPTVRVTLRSGLWPMSLTRQHRGFANMTAVDAIQQVCNDHQIKCRLSPSGSAVAANYVQYGESDLDFVKRMLAAEGLLWFAVEEESETTLVGIDDYNSLEKEATATFSTVGKGGFLDHFDNRLRTSTEKYRFTSVSAQQPDEPASQEATSSSSLPTVAGSLMSLADHPIGLRDPAKAFGARRPANMLAQRAAALAGAAEGESTIHLLCAGIRMTVEEHPVDDCNAKWILTEVSHTWRAGSTGTGGIHPVESSDETATDAKGAKYANEFTCVPAASPPLRPKMVNPPIVHGLRLGRISKNAMDGQFDVPGSTMDSGIYGVTFTSELNKAGEPLVQYMRVAHPWAGPERGFHFPLEVDDEVVVGHEHGNPERPFILGSLHGVTNVGPVVATEDGKGYSGVLRSRTGHEVRFDDDPGLKRILLKSGSGDHQLEFHDTDKKTALTTTGLLAEKVGGDHTSEVEGNRTTKITKNDELGVTGDRKVDVTKGEIHTVGEDHTLTVTGAENHSIGKDLTQKIDGASTVTVTKDAALTIKGAHTIDVTKDLAATVSGGIVLEATKAFSGSGKTITLEADDTLTLKCGSAKIVLEKNGNITIDGGKIAIKGSGDVTIKGSKTAVN